MWVAGILINVNAWTDHLPPLMIFSKGNKLANQRKAMYECVGSS